MYEDDPADSRFSSAQGRKRSPRGGAAGGQGGAGGGGGGGGYDDEGPRGGASKGPGPGIFHEDDEYDESDPDMKRGGGGGGGINASTRQIRPKATELYNDRDPFLGEEGDADDDNVPASFPPGQHPLENVPNFMELSAPEALRGKSREISESTGITNLVGEYRASCLFSKAWVLREAATQKIQMMLTEGIAVTSHVTICCYKLLHSLC